MGARGKDLVDKFVVMHSGNVSATPRTDNPVRATTYLRDLDDLAVPIIGASARLRWRSTTRRGRLDADKIQSAPLPATRGAAAIAPASASVHYVGLARGLSGFVVPSRLYGILAAGKPVIVAADADSETARLVEEVARGRAPPRPS